LQVQEQAEPDCHFVFLEREKDENVNTYCNYRRTRRAGNDDLQSMQNGHASVLRRDRHNHNESPELNPSGLLKPTYNP
jgi:hypothetical protein